MSLHLHAHDGTESDVLAYVPARQTHLAQVDRDRPRRRRRGFAQDEFCSEWSLVEILQKMADEPDRAA